MGRKYIKEQNRQNFIYPNNYLAQYGVEIVHDINNNSVSGTTANFTGTSISSSSMTFQFGYTWLKNSAEPYIRDSGYISILSIHMMTPDQTYFKPWRLVGDVNSLTTTGTTYSGTTSFTVTPDQFGLSSFTNGDYYFEIRFIGERAIYPVCRTYTVSTITQPTPTPTPTPTVTPSGGTPTPTPTPSVTPVLYQSGATLNVTDTGWIKYDSLTNGDDYYVFISTLGTYTITDCALCSSIFIGVPFADVANFTITNCGTSCGSAPVPTPTPSPSAGNNGYYIMTDCQTYQTRYSQLLPNGTFDSGDRVEGSFGYYYVITGFTPSFQATTYTVTATGQFGCP
jgi:hypothetical protein